MLPWQGCNFIYFVGIGGIGMSALARLLAAQGLSIFGYDRVVSSLVMELKAVAMEIYCEDTIGAIPPVIRRYPDKTLVIYTPAVPADSVILNFFKNNNYKLLTRAEVLGTIAKRLPIVAIAGTHGKTTTSAMVAHILYERCFPLVAFVGGIMRGYNSNIIYNTQLDQAKILIVEADEFNRSLLQLMPDYSVVTAVDLDHSDTYPTLAALEACFMQFIDQAQKVILMHHRAADQLKLYGCPNKLLLTYSLDAGDVQACNIHSTPRQTTFDYIGYEDRLEQVTLPIPGFYNVENALAAITMALTLGVDKASIRRAMASFLGIQRRFSIVVESEGIVYIDDYAHHPVELYVLLTTVRNNYPNSCITAIFQPHLFSRTAAFYSAFAQSLDIADQVFLLPIYPAREVPLPNVTAQLIFKHLNCRKKELVSSAQLLDLLVHTIAITGQRHIILTIGAGDIGEIVPAIAACLQQFIK